uniref:alpha-N-acetylgalactosaminidase-like n=1 Tax=Styela clava TaxID=7725 RepID=UPI001939C1BE|nr:alpha-N-acetylgalactosaminidase-like [Styela clava]
MLKIILQLATIVYICARCSGMNNGVARTPPMGWLAWERFRCVIDCKTYPDSCISEKLFTDMADRLVEDGWKDVGYKLVNIDDCWSSKQRNDVNELEPDPERFPSGIPYLANYMHMRGLKLGIYGDYGTLTCGGYPGSMGYEKVDAQTFARWGVDMLKFDGCYSNSTQQEIGYPLMSKELNMTGRHMIYSCSWPAYQGGLPPKVDYKLLGEICNLWRNYGDIQDSFESVMTIINWWGDNQDVLIPAAGPGMWNDPDMLIGGDFSLSYDEARLQFGMWAIIAAPLFISVDLRTMDPKFRSILQNEQVISVNQDPLGIQGRRVKMDKTNVQLWVRPLVGEEQAIAIFSTRTDGVPYEYYFTLSDLGIQKPASEYLMTDILDGTEQKVVEYTDTLSADVNPNGIRMFRAIPLK